MHRPAGPQVRKVGVTLAVLSAGFGIASVDSTWVANDNRFHPEINVYFTANIYPTDMWLVDSTAVCCGNSLPSKVDATITVYSTKVQMQCGAHGCSAIGRTRLVFEYCSIPGRQICKLFHPFFRAGQSMRLFTTMLSVRMLRRNPKVKSTNQ